VGVVGGKAADPPWWWCICRGSEVVNEQQRNHLESRSLGVSIPSFSYYGLGNVHVLPPFFPKKPKYTYSTFFLADSSQESCCYL
jgi:hypothetical protein